VTGIEGTADTASARRTVPGRTVPGALGAVLCALGVAPVWWHTQDHALFGRAPVGEPVWGADPWWSLAVLLGVAGCLLAVLGRPRARLSAAAGVAVSAVQLLTWLHRAWDTADRAVLASGAAAGVFAVHAVWDLSPVTGPLVPAVVAMLLGAQAIAVRLIGTAPRTSSPDGSQVDATR